MRHTVLVIDDQWSMQELARIVLQKSGYRVLLASDGISGLSLARTEAPDCVVLDLCLPGRASQEVLHGLRQSAHTALIPVVVITPDGTQLPLAEEPGTRKVSYLKKPFHPSALLLIISRLLRRRKPLRSTA